MQCLYPFKKNIFPEKTFFMFIMNTLLSDPLCKPYRGKAREEKLPLLMLFSPDLKKYAYDRVEISAFKSFQFHLANLSPVL